MFFSFRIARLLRRAALLPALALSAFALAALPLHAQFGAPSVTEVHDTSALHPPAGARVALVEFADMQCPDCANAYPMVRDAVAKYHIPLLYHDFPLPFHSWSFQAAVNTHWFALKSPKLAEEYRSYIFANQRSIDSLISLINFTRDFAKEHKLAFPVSPDPSGRLAASVKADYALGQRIGIEHTPTIWVVTSGTKGTPFVEVVDRGRLFQMIEEAIAQTHGRR